MKCGYPYKTPSGVEVSCGRCMPCRINRRQEWVARMIMEQLHSKTTATFFTLTYDPEHVPEDGNLQKQDLRKFIDRCRKGSLGQIRYLAVGEYGEKLLRPHYHGVFYDTPPEDWEAYIRDKWGLGFTSCSEFNMRRAKYLAQYTLKKLDNANNPRLDGKTPEFRVSCQRPPLGAAFAREWLNFCTTPPGTRYIARNGDIPQIFQHGGVRYRIPQYWVEKIRDWYGMDKPIYIEPTEAFMYETIKAELKKQARQDADNLAERHRKTHWSRRPKNPV